MKGFGALMVSKASHECEANRPEVNQELRLRLIIILLSIALLISSFVLAPRTAQAASHVSERPTVCSYHTVDTAYLLNEANGKPMGTLYLLADGCGNVKIHLQNNQSTDLSIGLSDGGYYMLYSYECYLAYDCWSSDLSYGHLSVFATGEISFQGIEYAYDETGYHNGYQ